MIRHVGQFKGLLPLIEGHHESYDGKGYPQGLKGEDIPLGARILAVADAYDAMTFHRPYRPRLTSEEALQVLTRGSGKQWDPRVVDALMEIPEQGHAALRAFLVE
jgi:HD-GYP domain-containing protein (c-di-GMP phosphodiesterase class II)